jgi:hypothetical protein
MVKLLPFGRVRAAIPHAGAGIALAGKSGAAASLPVDRDKADEKAG